MQPLPSIHALWIGKQLNRIAQSCLASFVRQGHQVHLHCYEPISNVPAGVRLCDANAIIPHSQIFKHRQKQSYAPFSDLFSYELLHRIEHGIYVDCDVYCLAPMHLPQSGYLFGYESYESGGLINVAVLAAPKDSPLLDALRSIGDCTRFMPPWYPPVRQWRLRIKRLFGRSRQLADMPWGITGPCALTYYVNNYNLQAHVQPLEVLYPIQYHTVEKLLDPSLTLDDVISQNSLCVHLYNEALKPVNLDQLHPECVLAAILREDTQLSTKQLGP